MKYGDLIQFEPIESVVQLREASLSLSSSSISPSITKGCLLSATTALVNHISCP
jgi:hypothetical protein